MVWLFLSPIPVGRRGEIFSRSNDFYLPSPLATCDCTSVPDLTADLSSSSLAESMPAPSSSTSTAFFYTIGTSHRFNMELDLQSLFGLYVTLLSRSKQHPTEQIVTVLRQVIFTSLQLQRQKIVSVTSLLLQGHKKMLLITSLPLKR